MKKLTATIVSVALMIGVLAMGASAGETKSADVMKDLNSTAKYLTTIILSGDENTVYKNDRSIIAILNADAENEQLKTAYTKSLKKALDENGGKLMYNGVESPSYYTSAMTILKMLGKNPSNFEGYNLVENFNNLDKKTIVSQTPYLLAYMLEFVTNNGDIVEDKTIASDLINALKAFYKDDEKKGSGYDYYGITVDTNGTIIPSLSPYCEKDSELKNQVEKSMAWLLEQYTEGGYNYGLDYPGINANSTGLALYALSETGDMQNAEKAYKALLNFKCEDVDGAYGYNNATNPNPGATNNVIAGLSAYYTALKATEIPEETTTEITTEVTETTTEIAETTTTTKSETSETTSAVSTTKASEKKETSVPKTGTQVSPIVIFVALVTAGGVIAVSRKKQTA